MDSGTPIIALVVHDNFPSTARHGTTTIATGNQLSLLMRT
jgi:hypothetical protein